MPKESVSKEIDYAFFMFWSYIIIQTRSEMNEQIFKYRSSVDTVSDSDDDCY